MLHLKYGHTGHYRFYSLASRPKIPRGIHRPCASPRPWAPPSWGNLRSPSTPYPCPFANGPGTLPGWADFSGTEPGAAACPSRMERGYFLERKGGPGPAVRGETGIAGGWTSIPPEKERCLHSPSGHAPVGCHGQVVFPDGLTFRSLPAFCSPRRGPGRASGPRGTWGACCRSRRGNPGTPPAERDYTNEPLPPSADLPFIPFHVRFPFPSPGLVSPRREPGGSPAEPSWPRRECDISPPFLSALSFYAVTHRREHLGPDHVLPRHIRRLPASVPG